MAKFPAPSARAKRITARDSMEFLKIEFASKQLAKAQKPKSIARARPVI
jgi:hypothetical protein